MSASSVLGLLVSAIVVVALAAAGRAAEVKVPVTFSGGHEIGPQDFGRPVVLIAAALDVPPDLFREAFSGVTPARGRGPSRDEARKNKEALLKVLAPHGVLNERLDEVSDHYRYRPDRGELWPVKPAKAHAVVADGKVLRVVVTEPGAGYCSVPQATIAGYPAVKLQTTLGFARDFRKNGRIAAIELISAPSKGAAK